MIPVIVLTGGLGAGKTTLLQRLLSDPRMAGTAVLVNEFGEIGLDHELIAPVDGPVMLMRSGCVCCTIRGDIAQSLRDLLDRQGAGEIAPITRVVIETTGLADPFPVLSTLQADPVMRSQVKAGGVITVVDAFNGPAALTRGGVALRQIAVADTLVLAKTDLVGAADARALEKRLRALNPVARLGRADAPLDEILPERPMDREIAPPAPAQGHNHDHSGIQTLSITRAGPVNWTAFGLWLTALLHTHGERIHRVKGILAVEQGGPPVAVHGVGPLVHPPGHLEHLGGGAMESRLVFIFEDLSPDALRRSFDLFDRLGHARAPLPETVC
ncbi:MAG: cobalamin biosynthesis protein CobW [Confluentimicrobium sp.]|uniref:CobW family GTP-binding protein n=1 Tax=Actibacterium sp. TaxID=1872125 RepID=UPI000C6385AD|nr:GTP-binding protein [Actibacterium sp.]MBC55534.1 cobalamin biosynthesis protein CobW [Actibacterium sp.]